MGWMKRLLKCRVDFQYPVKIVCITILAPEISYGFYAGVYFTGNLCWIVDNDLVELLCFVTERGFDELVDLLKIFSGVLRAGKD